jgi:hypothetical protein
MGWVNRRQNRVRRVLPIGTEKLVPTIDLFTPHYPIRSLQADVKTQPSTAVIVDSSVQVRGHILSLSGYIDSQDRRLTWEHFHIDQGPQVSQRRQTK